MSLVQLTIVGLLAAMLGSLLGFGAQAWLVKALDGLLRGDLPPPGFAPLGIGFLTAIAVLGGFALPPLLQLSRTPALRVLRRDVGPAAAAGDPRVRPGGDRHRLPHLLGAARPAYCPRPSSVGLAAFVALVAGAGWLLVWLTTRFRGGVGVSWRYGIANLGRRRTESVVQLTAFALGIMMLLLLAVVRNDLLNDWRRSLPADTPNFFFINIPPDEHQQFTAVPRRARRAACACAADGACAHDAHQRHADRRHQVRDAARTGVRQSRSEHHLGGSARRRQRDHRRQVVHARGFRQAAGVGVDRIHGGDEPQARRRAPVRHRRRDARRQRFRAFAR